MGFNIISPCRRTTRDFSSQGTFRGNRTVDKNFVKNTHKKGHAGRNVRVFSPRYFSNEKYMKNSFLIFKKGRGGFRRLSFPPYLCTCHVWIKPEFPLLTLTWQTLSMFNVCTKRLNNILCASYAFSYTFLLCLQKSYCCSAFHY